MKKLSILLVIFFVLFNVVVFAQNNNNEFRAIWVVTWDLINKNNSVSANKSLDEGIIENLKKANMNAVLWHGRQSGTAYYNSSYEPWGYYAGSTYPGYDPLEYAIEQAHKRGMEVHVWFNTFHTSSTASGTPAAEHPEWICRDANGNPMTKYISISPGLSAVREYLVNVAMEIVRNYDIDGLHLDYIRWSEYTTGDMLNKISPEEELRVLDGMGFTEERLKKIRAVPTDRFLWDIEHPYSAGVPEGFSSWEEWWRWSVTEFVKTLQDSIKSVKPWVKLSAAVLGRYNWGGWNGYYDVYQDAALWFNKGYVDQLMPMHYHWTTGSEFYDMLTGSGQDNWEYWIHEGIEAGRLYSVGPGSYILDEKNKWDNHSSIVNKCRTIDWVDGFQFFSYSSWKAHNYWDEVANTFFMKRTKIRAYSPVDSVAPDKPLLNVTKVDSLTFVVNISAPKKDTVGYRFALYLSKNSDFSKDTSSIYNIYFSDFDVVDTLKFTGNETSTKYYVRATLFDRAWNESEFSDLDSICDISSNPPYVKSINFSEGDTLHFDDDIFIEFSKQMDTASVENAISFSPEVNNLSYTWSDSNSKLLIKHDDFQKGADYILKISDNAMDLAGNKLDGNKDGESGDDFEIHFYIFDKDIEPPYIYSYYPEDGYLTVDDVVTLYFNELLDESTVKSGITLLKDNIESNVDIVANVFNEKHVVSIRPFGGFLAKSEYVLKIDSMLRDINDNSYEKSSSITFMTGDSSNVEVIYIDQFDNTSDWWKPTGSGSTVGVLAGTAFESSKDFYLPGTWERPFQKRSAKLSYVWDNSSSTNFIREYAEPHKAPRDTKFDTTYTLQCYLFGDSSSNMFRFALDENASRSKPYEVSLWYVIDWIGWRVISWDLSDPDMVGAWSNLGDQKLNGSKYSMDSFQFQKGDNSPDSGAIYIDNLMLVKKGIGTKIDENNNKALSKRIGFLKNYPNPFNNTTTISFQLLKPSKVKITIYNMSGRRVKTLLNEYKDSPGVYKVQFNASGLSSGVYLYQLDTGFDIIAKKMILIK